MGEAGGGKKGQMYIILQHGPVAVYMALSAVESYFNNYF